MLLWASVYVSDLLSTEAKPEILADLMDVQRPDGGWSMANLVDNANDPSLEMDRVTKAKAEKGYASRFLSYIGRDDAYKSSLASDGYATGFVIFVARQAGLTASDPRLQRGLAWLKSDSGKRPVVHSVPSVAHATSYLQCRDRVCRPRVSLLVVNFHRQVDQVL